MNPASAHQDNGSGNDAVEEIVAETEVARLDVYSEAIFEEAVETNTSDVFISDEANGVSIKFRRMGKLHHVRMLARGYGNRLQNHIRAMAGVNVGDVNRPAEGRNRVELSGGRQIDLRLSMMPTLFGQDLAIRIFDNQRGVIDLEDIGYIDEELEAVYRLLESPSGIVLVAGPSASGKSNSMYAFVRHLNNGNRKIHTLEDPVEYVLPGVIQSQVNLKAGMDFPELLYSVLRHSPDVIMIGEIRDKRTAEIAIRAANSGQLVLATVHAQTAASAIESMMVYGVDPRFLANSIVGIVAQRLVGRLCKKCRRPVTQTDAPDPIAGLRERLHTEINTHWYVAGGCTECRELGYDQLTLIGEVLEVNQAMRKAIAVNASMEELQHLAAESGMLTLEDSARINIARGVTTPQEISRVLGSMEMAELTAFTRDVQSASTVADENGSPASHSSHSASPWTGRWTSKQSD